ncbi:MAG TPA: hypothetical protein DHV26_05410 [Cytophagales bacterium]|jgi:hypothetical protein|nr:hypothetical protein [Cytophagales bacterium]HRG07595.1 hypothetical protein [Cyclobacteriaceae bacterium]
MMNTITLRPHIEQLRQLMLADITLSLALRAEIEFEHEKKLGSARELITGVLMQGDEFIVITKDLATGEGLYHDLDDERSILLEDLLWIHEQLHLQVA